MYKFNTRCLIIFLFISIHITIVDSTISQEEDSFEAISGKEIEELMDEVTSLEAELKKDKKNVQTLLKEIKPRLKETRGASAALPKKNKKTLLSPFFANKTLFRIPLSFSTAPYVTPPVEATEGNGNINALQSSPTSPAAPSHTHSEVKTYGLLPSFLSLTSQEEIKDNYYYEKGSDRLVKNERNQDITLSKFIPQKVTTIRGKKDAFIPLTDQSEITERNTTNNRIPQYSNLATLLHDLRKKERLYKETEAGKLYISENGKKEEARVATLADLEQMRPSANRTFFKKAALNKSFATTAQSNKVITEPVLTSKEEELHKPLSINTIITTVVPDIAQTLLPTSVSAPINNIIAVGSAAKDNLIETAQETSSLMKADAKSFATKVDTVSTYLQKIGAEAGSTHKYRLTPFNKKRGNLSTFFNTSKVKQVTVSPEELLRDIQVHGWDRFYEKQYSAPYTLKEESFETNETEPSSRNQTTRIIKSKKLSDIKKFFSNNSNAVPTEENVRIEKNKNRPLVYVFTNPLTGKEQSITSSDELYQLLQNNIITNSTPLKAYIIKEKNVDASHKSFPVKKKHDTTPSLIPLSSYEAQLLMVPLFEKEEKDNTSSNTPHTPPSTPSIAISATSSSSGTSIESIEENKFSTLTPIKPTAFLQLFTEEEPHLLRPLPRVYLQGKKQKDPIPLEHLVKQLENKSPEKQQKILEPIFIESEYRIKKIKDQSGNEKEIYIRKFDGAPIAFSDEEKEELTEFFASNNQSLQPNTFSLSHDEFAPQRTENTSPFKIHVEKDPETQEEIRKTALLKKYPATAEDIERLKNRYREQAQALQENPKLAHLMHKNIDLASLSDEKEQWFHIPNDNAPAVSYTNMGEEKNRIYLNLISNRTLLKIGHMGASLGLYYFIDTQLRKQRSKLLHKTLLEKASFYEGLLETTGTFNSTKGETISHFLDKEIRLFHPNITKNKHLSLLIAYFIFQEILNFMSEHIAKTYAKSPFQAGIKKLQERTNKLFFRYKTLLINGILPEKVTNKFMQEIKKEVSATFSDKSGHYSLPLDYFFDPVFNITNYLVTGATSLLEAPLTQPLRDLDTKKDTWRKQLNMARIGSFVLSPQTAQIGMYLHKILEAPLVKKAFTVQWVPDWYKHWIVKVLQVVATNLMTFYFVEKAHLTSMKAYIFKHQTKIKGLLRTYLSSNTTEEEKNEAKISLARHCDKAAYFAPTPASWFTWIAKKLGFKKLEAGVLNSIRFKIERLKAVAVTQVLFSAPIILNGIFKMIFSTSHKGTEDEQDA